MAVSLLVLLILKGHLPTLVGKVERLRNGDGHRLGHLPFRAEEGMTLARLVVGGGDEGEDVVVVGVGGAVRDLVNGGLQ